MAFAKKGKGKSTFTFTNANEGGRTSSFVSKKTTKALGTAQRASAGGVTFGGFKAAGKAGGKKSSFAGKSKVRKRPDAENRTLGPER